MKIGKIQQTTLNLIDTYKEFELLEYVRGHDAKVKLKCLNCGFEFERHACHFNKYPHVCPKCHPKGTSQKISMEEVQRRVDDIYGENQLKVLKYIGNNSKCTVQCMKCGEIFERVPTVLWRNRTKGCPICNQATSIGENKVREYLEYNHIQYIQQYRFEDCKYKIYLPFDFYLPQHNTCIEFQGEQHYREDSLYYSEEQIKRDKIKQDYCKNKGINLIIIPYWDLNKMDSYLNIIGRE